MKYSVISADKWTRKAKVLSSSNDINVIKAKYFLVLKYLKYMKELSPSKSLHRKSNLRVFAKIYKELHTLADIYPYDLLKPNIILLRDNKTGLVMSPIRFHKLVGGFIPPVIPPEYLQEQKQVREILSSVWQDRSVKYNFKYFNLN